MIWAIESLAPHIDKIQVRREGIDFLFNPDRWNNFKNQWNERFPGKMQFVDVFRLGEDDPDDTRGIWQENLPHKPTLIEKLQDVIEDQQRQHKDKIE